MLNENRLVVSLLFLISIGFNHVINAQEVRKYPTAAQVDLAHRKIVDIIEANKEREGRSLYSFPFRAGFVRLIFHDCTGVNGCDGCIDHSLNSNKGLERYTLRLDDEYDNNHSINNVMSKADFYILAGYVALEEASKHQTSPTEKIIRAGNFKVGRLSCGSKPPAPSPNFPLGIEELKDANGFFSTHFPTLNQKDKVAILGAHTLGEGRTENSGFQGKWVIGRRNGAFKSDLLDNEYYKKTNGNRWKQVMVGTKMQWIRDNSKAGRSSQQLVMNMDMSLQFNLKTNGNIQSDGTVSCAIQIFRGKCLTGNCCIESPPKNSPENFFRQFLKSNDVWIAAFKDAFNKITETRLASNVLRFPQ